VNIPGSVCWSLSTGQTLLKSVRSTITTSIVKVTRNLPMARNIKNRFLICDKAFINIYETFADTKGVARSRNMKKDRQYKGQHDKQRASGSSINSYLCNQCHHHWSCQFESRSWRGVLDTKVCDTVCQWFAIGRWFSPGTPVSSTNKTDHRDMYMCLGGISFASVSTIFRYDFGIVPIFLL